VVDGGWWMVDKGLGRVGLRVDGLSETGLISIRR
jgi:hypothetical protein